jgi:protein TonB
MVEVKKYSNVKLSNYSLILIQLGFVLALFIVFELIIYKSYPSEIKTINNTFVNVDDTENNIEIKIPLPPPIKNVPQPVIPDKIIKVEDQQDVVESVIESTESDENQAITITDVNKDVKSVEEEEEVVEDVPFLVIENVPVFPGCKGSNKQLRACFSNQVAKFVSKKFNSELASDLGLTPGSIQKIFVVFKIDKNGNVVDIKARAPEKKLQEEAIRVVKLLPKMMPGKQRGKAVGVKYGLPIVFRVE